MKEKLGMIIGLLITIILLATLALYILNEGTIEYLEVIPLIIIIILVTTATYIIWDRVKNVRKGLPTKDERLISINYKAGYYGFIAAI